MEPKIMKECVENNIYKQKYSYDKYIYVNNHTQPISKIFTPLH
jgi:hypothetical protein